MTELLLKALKAVPSLRQVEEETGVKRQGMMMLLKGRTITLANADKLARYFGIECHFKKGR